jgi:hypothetical protein
MTAIRKLPNFDYMIHAAFKTPFFTYPSSLFQFAWKVTDPVAKFFRKHAACAFIGNFLIAIASLSSPV